MRSAHTRLLSTAVALAFCTPAQAVSLSTDGRGQALIYPYYTANSVAGNAFNTYVSVVNHAEDEKIVRVRFREARMGKPVAELNVYLARNDTWVGAVIASGEGARFVTSDRTCIEVALPGGFDGGPPQPGVIDFRREGYLNDGAGDGFDRTREGYIEILEMATVTGAVADDMFHNAAGTPRNCQAALTNAAPALARPTGGLSGTLTLINVATGLDFTANAVALADLASRPYFRPAGDAYPDFNAAEIDPVSIVMAGGHAYRSLWSRGRDAVSAALMHASVEGEFTLDNATNSRTDLILTLPTRPAYPDGALGPFTTALLWQDRCGQRGGLGEPLEVRPFDRNQATTTLEPVFNLGRPTVCGVANASQVSNGRDTMPSSLLGSVTHSPSFGGSGALAAVPNAFQNGRVRVAHFIDAQQMTSLPGSMRVDLATGAAQVGAHRYRGLPMVGFTARTFMNGTLSCGGAACQGNYGGLFPLTYARSVNPVP